jgi:hypothetical protein
MAAFSGLLMEVLSSLSCEGKMKNWEAMMRWSGVRELLVPLKFPAAISSAARNA